MKIVLTGGGTGGHVLPAVMIGERLRQEHGAELVYIGNEHFIEKKIANEHNIPFYAIFSQGLEGNSLIEKYGGFLAKNSFGTLQALKLLKKIKPDLAVATGGFVSAPVMAACVLLKIPYIIHEQNSVAGKVNKLFFAKAKKVYLSIEGTEGVENGTVVGNPVRFNERRTGEGDKLVVLGGSGGSVFLNGFATRFARENPDIPVVLQAGVKYADELQKENRSQNLEIVGFCDLKKLYDEAKIVVARGGTGTLFELSNQCVPSVIVPLPTSAENHQYKNALHFSRTGGMKIIVQSDSFYETISLELQELWDSKEKRALMVEALNRNALRDSDKRMADDLKFLFLK